METLLRQLIVQMIRNYQGGQKARHHFKPATPAEAQDFIIEESFLYDYPVLTLEQLADRLGLGCRQTERLMQDIYGKTFLQKKETPACRQPPYCLPIQTAASPPSLRSWVIRQWSISLQRSGNTTRKVPANTGKKTGTIHKGMTFCCYNRHICEQRIFAVHRCA